MRTITWGSIITASAHVRNVTFSKGDFVYCKSRPSSARTIMLLIENGDFQLICKWNRFVECGRTPEGWDIKD